jgi:hypothetical protein
MGLSDALDDDVLADLGRPRAGWPIRLVGALVATVGLWLGAGPVGLLAGAGLAIGALRWRGWTLFALGQVALVALLSRGGPLAPIVAIEAGLFGLLVVDGRSSREVPWAVLETGAITGALGFVAWSAWRWGTTSWVVALLVAALVAVAAYGLHRYERLHLGYLEDHREHH